MGWPLGLIPETTPSKAMQEEAGQDVMLSESPFFWMFKYPKQMFLLAAAT